MTTNGLTSPSGSNTDAICRNTFRFVNGKSGGTSADDIDNTSSLLSHDSPNALITGP